MRFPHYFHFIFILAWNLIIKYHKLNYEVLIPGNSIHPAILKLGLQEVDDVDDVDQETEKSL